MQIQTKENKDGQIYRHWLESEPESELESNTELESKSELESDTE